MNQNFDKTFHYFRAFAILSVLGAHTWFAPSVPGMEDESRMLHCARSVLFHSSTIYFIFISGYLFDHVYKTRPFDLSKFYLGKVKHVLSPYLVLSALTILAGMALHASGLPIPAFINHGIPFTTAKDVVLACLRGTACVTYWYIPFILLVYLVSPLLRRIHGRPFAVLTVCLSVLPLIVQRDELVDFGRNFCFFFPSFVIGMSFSRHRTETMGCIRRHLKVFAFVTAAGIVLLCLEFHHQHLPSVETGYYVLRLAAAGLVIDFFETWNFESRLLDIIARYSFPLYFLHDAVMHTLGVRAGHVVLELTGSLFAATTFTYCCVVVLCMGLIWAVKRVTGRWSRMLVGG